MRMSEAACLESMYRFYRVVVASFGDNIWVNQLLQKHPICWQSTSHRDFLGCLAAHIASLVGKLL
jgi:hypothetical protein